MKKVVFTSNLSSTSAKIDRTEGFKKYCVGHSKILRRPWVGRPCNRARKGIIRLEKNEKFMLVYAVVQTDEDLSYIFCH